MAKVNGKFNFQEDKPILDSDLSPEHDVGSFPLGLYLKIHHLNNFGLHTIHIQNAENKFRFQDDTFRQFK